MTSTRSATVLAVAIAVATACSSSSGPSTFNTPREGGSNSSSSGGVSLEPDVPMCLGCSATGENDGGNCPFGWVLSGCRCYWPGHSCTNPQTDCNGQASVCLAEAVLDGAGLRCHCGCPDPSCS